MTTKLARGVCAAALCAAAAALGASATPGQQPDPTMTSAAMKAIADRYCVTCHNDRLQTGQLSLQHVDFDDVAASAELLEKAVRKLLVGAMPPQGVPRPDPATLTALRSGLESALDRAAASQPDPGRSLIRRLNRTEYANAVRDLVDLDVNVATLLPVDNSSYGFDNIADVLGMSPVLMERYLTAARRISALAVGDAAEILTTQDTYRVKPDLSQDRHLEGLPLGTRGGILVPHTFPLDAEYAIKVDLLQTDLNNLVGLEYPHQVVITLDGAEIHRAVVGGKDDLVRSFANSQGGAEEIGKRLAVRLKIKAGPHRIGAAFVEKSAAMRPGLLQPILRTTFEIQNYTGQPHVAALVVTGPFDQTGPGDTRSRRRIFVCQPSATAKPRQRSRANSATDGGRECATKILSSLATRAYRRPLTRTDVATIARFYDLGREQGSFDAGIEMGLRRILASPDFVLRVEREGDGKSWNGSRSDSRPAPVPVTDLELASRLSFFLWSTLPDDQLMTLANRGVLSKPTVLEEQVRRMLSDGKSRALVDNFAGQWLYLRNLRNVTPAPGEFPDFDHNLRLALQREVELFFESVLREDRSVMDLMDARDTWLNERLARHYGIPDVYGDQFRRVMLEGDERRGLLGKGAILLVTSLATRTSPVVRGKWILENIVGTPPQPPPATVPALEDTALGPEVKTLRDRMETHRRNQPCAGCHRVMDPIGFALENYDGIGRWRATDGGSPIDAAGTLMDGSEVDGPATLRQALTRNPDVFVRTMTEKMLTYALGRGLGARDMPAIRAITRSAARDSYRFSSLVLGIVNSVPFQMKVAHR